MLIISTLFLISLNLLIIKIFKNKFYTKYYFIFFINSYYIYIIWGFNVINTFEWYDLSWYEINSYYLSEIVYILLLIYIWFFILFIEILLDKK